MNLRWSLLLCALATGVPPVVSAQLSPAGLPVPGWPAVHGMAGAGLAETGEATRALDAAALAPQGPRRMIALARALGDRDAPVRAFRLGALTQLTGRVALTGSLTWDGLADVIEDPSVPETGLEVADLRATLGVGIALWRDRLALGVDIRQDWSQVFGTDATERGLVLSAWGRPVERIGLLCLVDGIGEETVYRSSAGAEGSVVVADKMLRCGTELGIVRRAGLGIRLYGDDAVSIHGSCQSDRGVGAILSLADLIVLRGGVTRYRSESCDAPATSRAALGAAIRVGRVGVEYAYARSGSREDQTPRHLLGVRLEAPRRVPVGGR